MPKKQTRRAISVSRETYDAIKKRAEHDGTTGSGLVEMVMRKFLDLEELEPKRAPVQRIERAVPEPTPEPKPKLIPALTLPKKEEPVVPQKPKDPILGDAASKIFTF